MRAKKEAAPKMQFSRRTIPRQLGGTCKARSTVIAAKRRRILEAHACEALSLSLSLSLALALRVPSPRILFLLPFGSGAVQGFIRYLVGFPALFVFLFSIVALQGIVLKRGMLAE